MAITLQFRVSEDTQKMVLLTLEKSEDQLTPLLTTVKMRINHANNMKHRGKKQGDNG